MSAYSNLKSMFLAINGYHPFSPDAGIFCGGYQGPLYPNPTKLIAPETGFNPLTFQNPDATPYRMASSGDAYYPGLGIGNPGINYRNPGHLLGIIDTFGRMSYGLSVLKAARDLSISSQIDPSVNINIPLLKFTEGTFDGAIDPIQMSLSDIYPAYSEIPSDYLRTFIESEELVFNPRTNEPFVFGGEKYKPNTNNINLELLFRNVSLESYQNLPELFQQYFQDMVTFANQMELTSENRNEWFARFLLIDSPLPGTQFYDAIGSLLFFDSTAPRIVSLLNNPVEEPLDFGNGYSGDGYTNKLEVLTREEALTLMTGENQFHNINNNQYEYRSLTELNSVIDIIPIQTHAFQWDGLISSIPDTLNPLGITRTFFSVSFTDVILNIIGNINIPQITINGNIRMIKESTGGNIGPFTIAPAEMALQRNMAVSTSHTNAFTWDKSWFGVDRMPSYNETSYETQNYEQQFFTGSAPDTVEIPITQFDFSHTFTLRPGNNCIRLRLITQYIATHFVLFETTVIDLNTNIPSLPNHYVVITNPNPDGSMSIIR
jgi:hypothetical protein